MVKKKEEKLLSEKERSDGYVDIAKKIGTGKESAGFILNLATDEQLARLYVGNGLAKRYIDLVVSDMIRQWITVPEDTEGKLLKYHKKIDSKKQIKHGLRCSKLFGGSLGFMVIDDGAEPNEPVNINGIKSVKKIKFFNRKYVTIDKDNYYKDPTKENFGEPEFFTLDINGDLKTIHESRCLIFKGEYYPQDELSENSLLYDKFWGLSILQSSHEAFEDYGLALQALARSLLKANVDVLKIKNLFQLLKNVDGQKQLDARARLFDIARSVSTTLLLDNDESYESVSQALNGFSDAVNKLETYLAGINGIPVNIFFGLSPKGLNATGDNEQRTYYDKVNASQEEELLPIFDKLNGYIKLAKDSGLQPKNDYTTEFNSLWQMTDKEKVDMRNIQAKTDEIYVNLGVVDPNEVRENRFNGNYSIETPVEGDAPELPNQEENSNNVSQ